MSLDVPFSEIDFALGAGPGLLKDNVVSVNPKEEEIADNIAFGRAPRTAVGIFPNGDILFITVDGRRPNVRIVMTLTELAEYMQQLGVKDSINLDGGGSTQMYLEGKMVNTPSQYPYRPLGSGFVIGVLDN